LELTIAIPPERVKLPLEAWNWIGLDGKEPILVSAFGDVFVEDNAGIWFLDTVEGKLERVCDGRSDLHGILNSEEGAEHYLLAGLARAAADVGLVPKDGQCYDFKVPPVLGGKVELENLQVMDFMVSLDITGQVHQQARQMQPGTRVSKVVIKDDKKPWWKVW
jgi:hypothetical protein